MREHDGTKFNVRDIRKPCSSSIVLSSNSFCLVQQYCSSSRIFSAVSFLILDIGGCNKSKDPSLPYLLIRIFPSLFF